MTSSLQEKRHTYTTQRSSTFRFVDSDEPMVYMPTLSSPGAIFAAATQQGSVYSFDLLHNKFWLVHRTGAPCTAIAFGSRQPSELLTGHSDNTFRCFDTNTGAELFVSEEGQSCVHHISVHAGTGDVMATAANEVSMWEMARYRIKRRLDGAKTLGVQQALYSAGTSGMICTSFSVLHLM